MTPPKTNENESVLMQTIRLLQNEIETLKSRYSVKIFLSKEEILKHYKWTEYEYKVLLKEGLPVWINGYNHYAHADNIEAFFLTMTRRSYKNAPDNVLEKISCQEKN